MIKIGMTRLASSFMTGVGASTSPDLFCKQGWLVNKNGANSLDKGPSIPNHLTFVSNPGPMGQGHCQSLDQYQRHPLVQDFLIRRLT